MDKSVESTQVEFNTVRTGRASCGALLVRIIVDYYEPEALPLKPELAGSDQRSLRPRMLTVQPFDPSSIKEIERAVQGVRARPHAVERRQGDPAPIPAAHRGAAQELVKIVRQIAEDGKVAIRNVRRDADKHLKELKTNGRVGRGRRAPRRGARPEAHDEHTHRSTTS
jgi:ribosome recycling factor